MHVHYLDQGNPKGPTLVLLHEGLGSVALWRDVPERLAESLAVPVAAGQAVELTLRADGFVENHLTLDGSEPSQTVKLERIAQGGESAPITWRLRQLVLTRSE